MQRTSRIRRRQQLVRGPRGEAGFAGSGETDYPVARVGFAEWLHVLCVYDMYYM
jgi:hypothetical protein